MTSGGILHSVMQLLQPFFRLGEASTPWAFLEGGHARVGPRLFPLAACTCEPVPNRLPGSGVESNRPLEFRTRLDVLADVCQHPFAPHILALNIEFMQTSAKARGQRLYGHESRRAEGVRHLSSVGASLQMHGKAVPHQS